MGGKADFNVIVVGAGPAGLLLALLLAQNGVPVKVLEKGTEISRNPRASHYNSPSIYELRRAGLMPDVMAKAFVPDGVAWRHVDGREVCRMEAANPPGGETVVSLPLHELLPIMSAHLARYSGPGGVAEVLLEHAVLGIGEDEAKGKAWVRVATPRGEEKLEATYVVGCDGAGSKIRRELFGDNFPGFTWDKQIVATNVYYPAYLEHMRTAGWQASTFMLHPEHFPMLAQITRDGLLRVTYGEEAGLTHEQMRARQPDKYRAFVPGAPAPDEYELVGFSPYRIHQRCAERFRKGRFLLAADAAHLCNPFGGMGLTGGLVDAGNLFDCLYGIFTGRADESILDKYSDVRIRKYREVIDPISSDNLRRLWDPSEAAIARDSFFQEALTGTLPPNRLDEVMHDFTQYYQDPAT